MVDASSAGNRPGDRRERADAGAATGKALVPAGPSASTGPRPALQSSAPFVAQLAAVHLGDARNGERRREDRPLDLVLPRARAAYVRTRRLATALEPGFILVREV